MAQVQIRLVGKTREDVEAALLLLQAAASVQVERAARPGRKGEWLAYASVFVPPALERRRTPLTPIGWQAASDADGLLVVVGNVSSPPQCSQCGGLPRHTDCNC